MNNLVRINNILLVACILIQINVTFFNIQLLLKATRYLLKSFIKVTSTVKLLFFLPYECVSCFVLYVTIL